MTKPRFDGFTAVVSLVLTCAKVFHAIYIIPSPPTGYFCLGESRAWRFISLPFSPFFRKTRKKSPLCARNTKEIEPDDEARRITKKNSVIEEKIRKSASFPSSKAMDRPLDFLPLDGDDSMLVIAFPSRHMSIPRRRLNQAAHLSWPGRGRGAFHAAI